MIVSPGFAKEYKRTKLKRLEMTVCIAEECVNSTQIQFGI